MAKQLGWSAGPASSVAVARRAIDIDIDMDAADPSTPNDVKGSAGGDPLVAAVLDPRDRSKPIEAPRMPIRNKDDSPLATEPKETPTPKAPERPRSKVDEIAAAKQALANPSEMKEEITPAPAVDLPMPTKKAETKEPTVATPRLREDRLAVAPDDPFAEIRIPNLNFDIQYVSYRFTHSGVRFRILVSDVVIRVMQLAMGRSGCLD